MTCEANVYGRQLESRSCTVSSAVAWFLMSSSNSSMLGSSLEILQAEMDEKLLGGLVKDRTAQNFLAACRGDEFLVEQRLDHAAGLNAADLLDLRNRHRLLVRDDGQRLQRSQRQAASAESAPEGTLSAFRGAPASLRSGDRPRSHGSRCRVGAARYFSISAAMHSSISFAIDIRQRLSNGVDANRLSSQINDCLKQGGKIGIAHSLDLRGALISPNGPSCRRKIAFSRVSSSSARNAVINAAPAVDRRQDLRQRDVGLEPTRSGRTGNPSSARWRTLPG